MKALKMLLFLPNILIAVVLGILFYLSMALNRLIGSLFFGWLTLTAGKPEVPEAAEERRESNG